MRHHRRPRFSSPRGCCASRPSKPSGRSRPWRSQRRAHAAAVTVHLRSDNSSTCALHRPSAASNEGHLPVLAPPPRPPPTTRFCARASRRLAGRAASRFASPWRTSPNGPLFAEPHGCWLLNAPAQRIRRLPFLAHNRAAGGALSEEHRQPSDPRQTDPTLCERPAGTTWGKRSPRSTAMTARTPVA
jgi:hypothetical protein